MKKLSSNSMLISLIILLIGFIFLTITHLVDHNLLWIMHFIFTLVFIISIYSLSTIKIVNNIIIVKKYFKIKKYHKEEIVNIEISESKHCYPLIHNDRIIIINLRNKKNIKLHYYSIKERPEELIEFVNEISEMNIKVILK